MVAEGGEGENLRGGGGSGGGVGGGGRGGGRVGGVSRSFPSRSPTSEAAVSADTHAFARLPPGRLRKNVGKRPQAPGGPGPKPWGPGPQAPWRPGPQGPGAWIPLF